MGSPQAIEPRRGNFFFVMGRIFDGRSEGVSKSVNPINEDGETPRTFEKSNILDCGKSTLPDSIIVNVK